MTYKSFTALLVLFLSIAAQACSCAISGSPCGAAKLHDTQFTGKVLRLRYEDHMSGPNVGFRRRVYTFSVTESFSDKVHPGEEVEIETGMGGGDCGYTFNIGEPYFVDAFTNNGRLGTGICSKTSPESSAQLILSELRAALHGDRLPTLAGLVLQSDPERTRPSLPLAGITVTATSADGQVFTTTTDANGLYRFASLLPATYTMHFATPPALIPWNDKPGTITIPDQQGASPACHAGYGVSTGGRITVHAVDKDGNTVPGFFAAYPSTQKCSCNWSAAGFNNTTGDYTLSPLGPRTYRIEFERKDTNKPTFYYPGTQDKASAEPVTVEEGQTKDIRLVLP